MTLTELTYYSASRSWKTTSVFKRLDPWILGALSVAVLVRVIQLDVAALWFDETLTASKVALDWDEMIHVIFFGEYGANHLPLYFLVVKAWTWIGGFSPWSLRLPSVLFSVATVALTAGIASTLVGKNAARWAAWLAALSPYLLHHAQEARMYPMMSMLAATCLILLARFLTGRSTRLGVGFVLANVALIATHYYAMFFVAAEVLVLLLLRPQPWKLWLPAICVTCASALVPVLTALLLAGHESGEIYEIGMFALPGMVWSMLSGYTLLPSSEELHAVGLKAVQPYLPYALVSIVPLMIGVIGGVRSMSAQARVVLLSIIAVTVLAPLMVTFVFSSVSINPRYVMTGAPAFFVLLAAGAPRQVGDRVRVAASILLIAVMSIASAWHLLDPGHGREDMYAVGSWLDENVSATEEILVTSGEMADLARFHWPNRNFRLYPARGTRVTSENADAVVKRLPTSESGRIIYLFGRVWLSDPDNVLRDAIGNRYSQCPGTEARGIRVLCAMKPST